VLSIQTNVNSLVAQQNLNVNNVFQSKTITQLTSGYRINQSGDDAAGLAVANKFRNSEAELTQGVANGNDATAQLQIMDGGISNISQVLDRLQTLATQSASGTFTGSRTTLNSEFQTDLGEIDRQAQSIGLNSGGLFNTNLNVYLGEGSGSSTLGNGIVTLGLTGSAVDSQALGLKGLQAVAVGTGASSVDLGAASLTSVSAILGTAANTASEATSGYTTFSFSGAGFSGASAVPVSVNLSGVSTTASLVTAINSAIAAAGASGSPAGAAFAAAGIVASVNTDSTGKQQLAFTSSTSAFQVQAGDKMANALMGNFLSGTTGAALATTVTGGATSAATWSPGAAVQVQIQGGGLATPVTLTVAASDANSGAAIADLAGQVKSNAALQAAGISMSGSAGSALVFTSATGQSFNVMATGDTTNQLGLGSFYTSATALPNASGVTYNSITGASANSTTAAQNQATMQFSINGAAATAVSVNLAAGPSATAATSTSSAISNPVMGANTALAFSVDNIAVSGVFTPPTDQAAAVGSADIAAGVALTAATTSSTVGGAAITATNWLTTPSSFTVNVNGAGAQTIVLDMNYATTANDAALQLQINNQLKNATVSIASGIATFTATTAGNAGNPGTGIAIAGTAASLLTGGGSWTQSVVGANGTNKFMVSQDGGVAKEIDALNGAASGTVGVSLTTLQNNLNTAFGGGQVTASLNGSGDLVLTSSTLGANSGVTVSNVPASLDVLNSGMTALFGATTTINAQGITYNAASVQGIIQGWINTAATNAGGGMAATVTVNGSNEIVVTNNAKGAGHSVSAFTGSAATNWFGTGTPVAGTNQTGADTAAYLNQVFASNAALIPAQLKATFTGGGGAGTLQIASTNGTNFRVNSGSTASGTLTGTASQATGFNFNGTNETFKVSVDGGAWSNAVTLNTNDTNAAGVLGDLQAAMTAATVTGVTASLNGNYLVLTSNTVGATSSIQVEAAGGTSALTQLGFATGLNTSDANLGFGVSGSSFTTAALATAGANPTTAAPKDYVVDAGGASSLDLTSGGVTNAVAFNALQFGNDSQAITITANNANGAQQSQTITLANNATNQSGANIDSAINYINKQLQQSDNATLQSIVAVKENNGSTDQINFISSLSAFNVSVGSTANGAPATGDGLNAGVSKNYAVGVVGAGANMSINTQAGAEAAVVAVGAAVAKLGAAQAAVGIGENQLAYGINLAQSQITNEAAAESNIRDANVAQQAANLTKAQVLQQASIAAMAQANSAPQAVLALLRT
jgi:flagellin